MSEVLPLVVRDERLFDLFDREPKVERLADGFRFLEGPIWHPDEHWLVFSDIPASRQYRWTEEDGVRPFRFPSNMANGNCFDPEGRIVTCEHGSSMLTRLEHDNRVATPRATRWQGRALNSPNDVVCDRAGRIYFTDPPYGRIEHRMGVGYPRERELDFQGVYRCDPDGSLHLLADDFEGPNGICLSVDGTSLFVSDSARQHIRRFQLDPEGHVSGGDVWAEAKADGVPEERTRWVVDGLKSDMSGNMFSSGPGGIHVIGADATPLGVLLTPEKSANFCFGGVARDHLFTTSCTGLYRIATRTKGPSMIPGRS